MQFMKWSVGGGIHSESEWLLVIRYSLGSPVSGKRLVDGSLHPGGLQMGGVFRQIKVPLAAVHSVPGR